MKLNFIVVILLSFIAESSMSQSNIVITHEITESGDTIEYAAYALSNDLDVIRHSSLDLIEKNNGIQFAVVTLQGNLIHIFSGKVNNAEFDVAVEDAKKFSFIKSFEKINANDFQVEFIHGVTDSEQRYFYEKLGYSGYTFKTN